MRQGGQECCRHHGRGSQGRSVAVVVVQRREHDRLAMMLLGSGGDVVRLRAKSRRHRRHRTRSVDDEFLLLSIFALARGLAERHGAEVPDVASACSAAAPLAATASSARLISQGHRPDSLVKRGFGSLTGDARS